MRKQKKPDNWDEIIHYMVNKAKMVNATYIAMNFHRCKTYEGWCIEVTVKKHEHHCEEGRDE